MANRTRAERRHLRAHLIIRRDKEYARLGVAFPKETDWHFKSARVRARTAALCSCALCGNPRKYYGNSTRSLTRQEVKASNWRLEIE